MSVEDTDALLTISQVAKQISMSENTVRNFIRQNKIPFLLLGGLYRFKQSDITDWIESGRGIRPSNSKQNNEEGVTNG
jgi:excisionase family DNA binding protein|tara:strand:+ start:532 stop:765 length:234 start_codon:yes stop_codon:yes gene_type:complete